MAAVTLANAYELIVTSANLDDPTKRWRNTFGIYQTGSAPAYGDDIVGQTIDFLAQNQWHDSQVITAQLRNWSRGDVPLEDEGFIWQVEGINEGGSAMAHYSFSEDAPADGDICMLVHKTQAAVGGRIGKLYLHNLIRTGMITYVVGGRPVFQEAEAALPSLVTADAAATFDAGFFGVAASPGFCTIHYAAHDLAATPFKRGLSAFTGIRLTEHQLGRGQ